MVSRALAVVCLPGLSSCLANALLHTSDSSDHVWPELALNWRSIVASCTGFLGAALGSAGGVGGGAIFVPTINLIIGFDSKSSTALSKCMIMGAALATVGYNLTLKHPLQDSPLIDYDLALLLQPMLLLGISIGVILNTIFPTWIITLLLVIILAGTGARTLRKAVAAWKKEANDQKLHEEQQSLLGAVVEAEGVSGCDKSLADPNENDRRSIISSNTRENSLLDTLRSNILWKNVAVLCFVWLTFVTLQILQKYTQTCSATYWIIGSIQIPVAVSAFLVAAIKLYRSSNREDAVLVLDRDSVVTPMQFGICKLGVSAGASFVAGMIGGMLGLGGGFALAPLLLEFGVHPQVFTATATFAMLFSSSMSVVEYHLLHRFPIPYGLYLFVVSILGGISGQYIITSLIKLVGRASIIIFLLTSLTFLSVVILGATGLEENIYKWKTGEYMGFSSLC